MSDASIHIEAPPEKVYAMVSDVTRMGEWSPECQRGEWLGGAAGPAVGARFKGYNKRKLPWSTTSVVTAAEPGREFAFAVGKSEEAAATRWRYVFSPSGAGTDVVESYEIVKEPMVLLRFLNKLGTGVSWKDRPAQIAEGMEQTLQRLKAAAERS